MLEKYKPFIDAPLVFLTAVFLYIAVLGAISCDYSTHWDEDRIIYTVQYTMEKGQLLPRWYNYPSMTYNIALIMTTAKLVWNAWKTQSDIQKKQLKIIIRQHYKHQLRSLFFLISIGCCLPVYLFIRAMSNSSWVGLLAALALLTSWEFMYQARWIAPDAILMFFISCSLFSQYQLLTSQEKKEKIYWAIGSSIIAGLCIGSKYPGGIILVSLLLSIALSPKNKTLQEGSTRLIIVCIAVTCITFINTTPGCALEPVRFINNVRYEIHHYVSGPHYAYTIHAGKEHFSKMLTYLFFVVPSKNKIIAIVASLFIPFGIIHIIRTTPRIAVWFLSVPVLYICYFSIMKVMIVRNYILLFPYFIILISLGIYFLYNLAQNKKFIRFTLILFSIYLITYNICVTTKAFLNINPESIDVVEKYIHSASNKKIYLSPGVQKIINKNHSGQYNNITSRLEDSDTFIFLSTEVKKRGSYKANKLGRYHILWNDCEEVNFDYYPSWKGGKRIIEVSTKDQDLQSLIHYVLNSRRRLLFFDPRVPKT